MVVRGHQVVTGSREVKGHQVPRWGSQGQERSDVERGQCVWKAEVEVPSIVFTAFSGRKGASIEASSTSGGNSPRPK